MLLTVAAGMSGSACLEQNCVWGRGGLLQVISPLGVYEKLELYVTTVHACQLHTTPSPQQANVLTCIQQIDCPHGFDAGNRGSRNELGSFVAVFGIDAVLAYVVVAITSICQACAAVRWVCRHDSRIEQHCWWVASTCHVQLPEIFL